jgi:hypothetical protein
VASILLEVDQAQVEVFQAAQDGGPQIDDIQILPIQDLEHQGPSKEQAVFTLFNHVVYITHQDDSLRDFPIMECQLRWAMSVMYNGALFMHQEGIRTGRSVMIVKALRYYRAALSMLNLVVDHLPKEAVLKLALLNNMGHAEVMLANLEKASEYLADIAVALADAHDIPGMQIRFIDFFIHTACIASHGCLPLSPAA